MVQRKYKVVGVNKCLNIYFFSSLWGVLHQQFVIRCWQIESGILGLLLCTNLCGSWKRACVQSDSVFSVALGCFFWHIHFQLLPCTQLLFLLHLSELAPSFDTGHSLLSDEKDCWVFMRSVVCLNAASLSSQVFAEYSWLWLWKICCET